MNGSSEKRMIDEYVSYRRNGVCRIADITTENFGRQGRKQYYVLRSVYDKNVKVFVPIGSELEKEMKSLPTKNEVMRFISEVSGTEIEWSEDSKMRASYFESLMAEGDRTKILCMMLKLRGRRDRLDKMNKKLKANDAKFLAMSENLITGEFAFVLDIQRSEVIPFITERLAELEKG